MRKSVIAVQIYRKFNIFKFIAAVFLLCVLSTGLLRGPTDRARPRTNSYAGLLKMVFEKLPEATATAQRQRKQRNSE
jgi:hypothetical protein